MTGTRRLPAGEPRKASQRHSRNATQSQARVTRVWNLGEQVRWRERIGYLAAPSMTANTPKSRLQIERIRCVSAILPDLFAPDTVRVGYHQETPDTNPHVDGASEAPQVGSRHNKTAEAEAATSEPRSASDKGFGRSVR